MADEKVPPPDTFLEAELDAIMEDASDALEFVRVRLKEYGGTVQEQSEQCMRWMWDLARRFQPSPSGDTVVTLPMLHLMAAYSMVTAARITNDPRIIMVNATEANRIREALNKAPPKPDGRLN